MRPPAAMAAGNVEISQRITDTLLGALAHCARAHSGGLVGHHEQPHARWTLPREEELAYYETIAGGMGASPAGLGVRRPHPHDQ